MSRSPLLGAVSFATEATWAEPTGGAFGTRVPTIGALDVSGLKQAKLVPDRTIQFKQEITPPVNGAFGGTFKTKFMLTGHGSTTAGVITLSALETILGIVLGNVVAARAAGGTTAAAGGTKSTLNVVAANGYLAGALIAAGVIADGRGNGQMVPCITHVASVVTTLLEIDAALNAADVVWNPANAYTVENPVAAPGFTSTRWLLQTANAVFETRGCYPKAMTIAGLGPSEEPSVEITWGVSVWDEINTPLPNVTAVQWFAHAPISAGSVVLQTYGTVTRNAASKYNVSQFSLTYTLGVADIMGPGGVAANQVMIGANRTQDKIAGEMTVSAQDTTATPDLLGKWRANTVFQLGYTGNAEDGKAIGLYLPYVVPDGDPPTQFAYRNYNSVKLKFRAGADNTRATDLERSALRIALR